MPTGLKMYPLPRRFISLLVGTAMVFLTFHLAPDASAAQRLDLDYTESGQINELVIAPGIVPGSTVTLSWKDYGQNHTTVILKTPPTGYQYFSLRDPIGHVLWKNATVQSNGDVVFMGIPVSSTADDWVILGDGSDILTFPMRGDIITGGCKWTYDIKARRTLWTPVVIAHAPSLGTGEAGTSDGKAFFYEIKLNVEGNWVEANRAKHTSFEYGVDQATSDGQTSGWFQLAVWVRAQVNQYCWINGGYSYFDHGETTFMEEALSGSVSGTELYGSSTSTDEDDVQSYTGNGYSGVVFKNRHTSLDHAHDHQGTGDASYTYSKKRVVNVGGKVYIDLPEAFNIAYNWKYSGSTSTHGKIVFRDEQPVCVGIDWLGGGSEESADWGRKPAFKTLNDEECAEAMDDLLQGLIMRTSDLDTDGL